MLYFRCSIKLYLFVLEQILHNIKQEYKRLQKRRHLDNAFQQADGCCPLELQNIHAGLALPGDCHCRSSREMLIQLVLLHRSFYALFILYSSCHQPSPTRTAIQQSFFLLPVGHLLSRGVADFSSSFEFFQAVDYLVVQKPDCIIDLVGLGL